MVETAAERLRTVKAIGELKAATSTKLFHRERERQVFAKARVNAKQVGLPTEVAESLMTTLVGASHDSQSQLLEQAQSVQSPKNILIIGGHGQMGRLLGGALAAVGNHIDVLDVGDESLLASKVSKSDIVIVSVPMEQAVRVAKEAGGYLGASSLLCDINSLKTEICETMESSSSGEVLGLHPMFGPSVASLKKQKIVACKIRDGALTKWLLETFEGLGIELLETTPKHHDKMMAAIQVLTHFGTITMGETLRREGFSVEESLKFTSPIYRMEMAFVGRLFSQDPNLYAEIEMANPASMDIRETFQTVATELSAIINAGDRDSFREVFRGVREHMGEFSEEAMRLSDLMIDALVARA